MVTVNQDVFFSLFLTKKHRPHGAVQITVWGCLKDKGPPYDKLIDFSAFQHFGIKLSISDLSFLQKFSRLV